MKNITASIKTQSKQKISIVYDMTKTCPWNCAICCMGASSNNSASTGELSYSEKLVLADYIIELNKTRDVHIDFSGGEVFTNMDNIKIIEYIAEHIGREKIGISSSGYKITDEIAKRLSKCINDCEMTMDVVPGTSYHLRPIGYALAAENALPHLQKYGIGTGIQTVLAKSNCNTKTLTGIYDYLCEHKVKNWSLLKFYPSGRGAEFWDEQLSNEDEEWVVSFIQQLDEKNTSAQKPEIDFHYTMKGHKKYSTVCRCVRKSIGILPDGTVTSCFWAVDSSTGIINDKFNLGSVKEKSLVDILGSKKAHYWSDCTHCCELNAA